MSRNNRHFINGHNRRGISPSKEAIEKQRDSIKSKRNFIKKIRITPFHTTLRHSYELKIWRKQIFQRDNYTCQECFARNGNGKTVILEAHHLNPFAIILREFLQEYNQFSPIEDSEILLRLAVNYKKFWELSNGQTLCKYCHDKTRIGIKTINI